MPKQKEAASASWASRSDARLDRSPAWRIVTLTVVLLLATTSCSANPAGPSSAPRDQSTPSGPPAGEAKVPEPGPDPEVSRLSPKQWRAMKSAGMARPECPIQRPGSLRSVRINFVDFEGRIRRGQLVVNADVAGSTVRTFSQLFAMGFPLRRMKPVEVYDGDTNASLRADNTSAYNCRRADQINAPFRESPHANGRAIDINPRENPWKDLRCRCWVPSSKSAARQPGPGVILRQKPVWRTFVAEGWVWQDIDVPDYMHFDTGYPSRPLRPRTG